MIFLVLHYILPSGPPRPLCDTTAAEYYYIPSNGHSEIDEIVLALDVLNEEADDYQSFAEQTLAANKNPQMSITSKSKTENWM